MCSFATAAKCRPSSVATYARTRPASCRCRNRGPPSPRTCSRAPRGEDRRAALLPAGPSPRVLARLRAASYWYSPPGPAPSRRRAPGRAGRPQQSREWREGSIVLLPQSPGEARPSARRHRSGRRQLHLGLGEQRLGIGGSTLVPGLPGTARWLGHSWRGSPPALAPGPAALHERREESTLACVTAAPSRCSISATSARRTTSSCWLASSRSRTTRS